MKVTVCLRYEAGAYWGGGEIQAARTVRQLEALGIQADYFAPMDTSFGDVVHFFGAMPYYADLARQLDKRRVPYVCSPIFLATTSGARLRARAARDRIRKSFPRELQSLFQGAKRLLTLTAKEEADLNDYFGGGLAPFQRVPIGVEGHFATSTPGEFREAFQVKGDFVLNVGALSKRKNQLSVARAAAQLGVPAIFIGPALEADYAEECKRAAGKWGHFVEALPHDSPLLASAYAAAKAFCFPSAAEIFSSAALEAATSGCALVLSDTWGADSIFGSDACYVHPGRQAALVAALANALESQVDRIARRAKYGAEYSWPSVARMIASIYEEAVRDT